MGRRPRLLLVAAVLASTVAAACDGDEAVPALTSAGTVASTTRAASVAVTTTTGPTTVAPSTPSTVPPTTAAPSTTVPPGITGLATDALEVRRIGTSTQGRPITAVRRGTAGGVRVLVIGVIHGDEDDGVAVLERLAIAPVPAAVELWLVESMNPDGQAAQQRGNAAGVDLNRNFPFEWGPIAQPGDGQYAGSGPASEPETRAIVDLVGELTPSLVLWYHQDLFRLSPGQGLEGELKQRYADLTGLPIERITGGTYTGVAATWVRSTTDAISFIVELGPSLSPPEADAHAAAVLDISAIVSASLE